jgi:hypothetical protein
MTLTLPKIAVLAAVGVAGYFGYRAFFGNIETKDVGELVRVHRESVAVKRPVVRGRVLELYDPATHCGLMVEALRHESPVTRALAVDVLAARAEEAALPQFLEMLNGTESENDVRRELAKAMGAFHKNPQTLRAVNRLIEWTDDKEDHGVRVAAHDALVLILESGAQVKFGEGMRTRWKELWRGHRKQKDLAAMKGK